MSNAIPETMKAVRLASAVKKYDESVKEIITVEDVPVPKPRSGQVLIKVVASTVNPSDLSYMKGEYGKAFTPPCGAGFEGSGRVVASGGGLLAWRVMGAKVSFYSDSCWAEYVCVPAATVIPIHDSTPFENAAGALVNPLTVLSFIDIAKQSNHKAIVHTAGASALGRMLIRAANEQGIKTVCIVRREEQAETCRNEGCAAALNSEAEGFADELKKVTAELDARIAFDAVGGPLTGQVISKMPAGSTIHIYGGLSGKAVEGVPIKDLIFQGKTVTGFWLTPYLKKKNMIQMMMWSRTLAANLEKSLASPIAARVSLEDGADAIADAIVGYVNNMSAGKVIIRCSSDAAEEKDQEEKEKE